MGMQMKHQAETIAQLREEVTQWKSQLSRLEETSRREVQDWKEQYLRAEQERSRLSARVDELIAEQLQVCRKGLFYCIQFALTSVARHYPGHQPSDRQR